MMSPNSKNKAQGLGYYQPPPGTDFTDCNNQDWLVPELKAEIEAYWPREGDWDSSGQVDKAKLAKAAALLFYPGRRYCNVHQLKQSVEYFGSKWGGFPVKRSSGYSIVCGIGNCNWIIRCTDVASRDGVPMALRPVRLTTANFHHQCKLVIDEATATEESRERRINDQIKSIAGNVFDQCPRSNPTIKFVQGNAEDIATGQEWLEKIEQSLLETQTDASGDVTSVRQKKRKSEELYTGADRTSGMPPPHIYQSIQFCDKRLLPRGCQAIKVLADAQYKLEIVDCRDFDEFVTETANKARTEIQETPEFQGAAIRSLLEDPRRAWYEKLGAINTMPNVLELLSENQTALEDPFRLSFRSASFHYQTEGQETQLSVYYSHKDKAGNVVAFKSVAGMSYNLLASQSKYPKTDNGAKEQAAFENEHDSYEEYQAYKESVSESDRKKIEKFEADFMKKATASKLPRVWVFKMTPSDKLMFAASDYLHGTVIPKQEPGIRRALLVFHDLIPYYAC